MEVTFPGAYAIWRGRTETYSAALPKARPRRPHTRSPARSPVTAGSTSATSPTKSMPVRCGKRRPVTRRTFPARPCTSPPLTLAAWTRTSTSPGLRTGTGTRPS